MSCLARSMSFPVDRLTVLELEHEIVMVKA